MPSMALNMFNITDFRLLYKPSCACRARAAFAVHELSTIDLNLSRWFMLVVMQAHATEAQVHAVCQKIEALGYRAHSIPGAERTAIGITGNKGEVEPGTLEEMSGVQEGIV